MDRRLALKVGDERVGFTTYAHSPSMLYTSDGGNTVRCWKIWQKDNDSPVEVRAAQLLEQKVYPSPITTLHKPSAFQGVIISGNKEGQVHLWDKDTMQVLALFQVPRTTTTTTTASSSSPSLASEDALSASLSELSTTSSTSPFSVKDISCSETVVWVSTQDGHVYGWSIEKFVSNDPLQSNLNALLQASIVAPPDFAFHPNEAKINRKGEAASSPDEQTTTVQPLIDWQKKVWLSTSNSHIVYWSRKSEKLHSCHPSNLHKHSPIVQFKRLDIGFASSAQELATEENKEQSHTDSSPSDVLDDSTKKISSELPFKAINFARRQKQSLGDTLSKFKAQQSPGSLTGSGAAEGAQDNELKNFLFSASENGTIVAWNKKGKAACHFDFTEQIAKAGDKLTFITSVPLYYLRSLLPTYFDTRSTRRYALLAATQSGNIYASQIPSYLCSPSAHQPHLKLKICPHNGVFKCVGAFSFAPSPVTSIAAFANNLFVAHKSGETYEHLVVLNQNKMFPPQTPGNSTLFEWNERIVSLAEDGTIFAWRETERYRALRYCERYVFGKPTRDEVLFVLNVLNVNEWKVLLQVPDDDFALKIFEESRSRCAQFLIDSRHAHVTRRMRLTIIGNPSTGKATLFNRLIELLDKERDAKASSSSSPSGKSKGTSIDVTLAKDEKSSSSTKNTIGRAMGSISRKLFKLSPKVEEKSVLNRSITVKDIQMQFRLIGSSRTSKSAIHFFLSSKSFFIITFDITADLRAAKIVNWLNRLQARSPGQKVFLIATHSDKINANELPDLVKMRNEELRRFLKNWEMSFVQSNNILEFVKPSSSQTFWIVSQNDPAALQNLADKIIQLSESDCTGEQVPCKYILMLSSLAKYRSESPLLPIDKVFRLGASLGLDEDQTQNGLMLYHSWGEIFYFNDNWILRQWVIIDPRWMAEVSNAISCINSNNLSRSGTISRDELIAIWKNQGFDESLYPYLIELLVAKFSFLVPQTATMSHFLVPSSLSPTAPNAELKQILNADHCFREYHLQLNPTDLTLRLYKTILELQHKFELQVKQTWTKGVILVDPITQSHFCAFTQHNVKTSFGKIVRFVASGSLGLHFILHIHRLFSSLVQNWYPGIFNNGFKIKCGYQENDMVVRAGRPEILELYFQNQIKTGDAPASQDQQYEDTVNFEKLLPELVIPLHKWTSGESASEDDERRRSLSVDLTSSNENVSDGEGQYKSERSSISNELFSSIRMIKCLGEGGFGTVYKGEFQGQIVAVKMMKIDRFTLGMIDDFCKEASVLSRLQHPNILRMLYFFPRPPAIVMEFCKLGNLEDLLHDDSVSLSWEMILKIGLDIAKGMEFMHNHKPPIIHCDLRSPNILVKELSPLADVSVVIADVGNAHLADVHGRASATFSIETDVEMYGVLIKELIAKGISSYRKKSSGDQNSEDDCNEENGKDTRCSPEMLSDKDKHPVHLALECLISKIENRASQMCYFDNILAQATGLYQMLLPSIVAPEQGIDTHQLFVRFSSHWHELDHHISEHLRDPKIVHSPQNLLETMTANNKEKDTSLSAKTKKKLFDYISVQIEKGDVVVLQNILKTEFFCYTSRHFHNLVFEACRHGKDRCLRLLLSYIKNQMLNESSTATNTAFQKQTHNARRQHLDLGVSLGFHKARLEGRNLNNSGGTTLFPGALNSTGGGGGSDSESNFKEFLASNFYRSDGLHLIHFVALLMNEKILQVLRQFGVDLNQRTMFSHLTPIQLSIGLWLEDPILVDQRRQFVQTLISCGAYWPTPTSETNDPLTPYPQTTPRDAPSCPLSSLSSSSSSFSSSSSSSSSSLSPFSSSSSIVSELTSEATLSRKPSSKLSMKLTLSPDVTESSTSSSEDLSLNTPHRSKRKAKSGSSSKGRSRVKSSDSEDKNQIEEDANILNYRSDSSGSDFMLESSSDDDSDSDKIRDLRIRPSTEVLWFDLNGPCLDLGDDELDGEEDPDIKKSSLLFRNDPAFAKSQVSVHDHIKDSLKISLCPYYFYTRLAHILVDMMKRSYLNLSSFAKEEVLRSLFRFITNCPSHFVNNAQDLLFRGLRATVREKSRGPRVILNILSHIGPAPNSPSSTANSNGEPPVLEKSPSTDSYNVDEVSSKKCALFLHDAGFDLSKMVLLKMSKYSLFEDQKLVNPGTTVFDSITFTNCSRHDVAVDVGSSSFAESPCWEITIRPSNFILKRGVSENVHFSFKLKSRIDVRTALVIDSFVTSEPKSVLKNFVTINMNCAPHERSKGISPDTIA